MQDTQLFLDTLLNISIETPAPTKKAKQNYVLDKGYGSAEKRMLADLLD